jgi:flagellar biosynthesis/type III secretory pathway chaperone
MSAAETLQAFIELLRREQTALVNGDIDALAALIPEKTALTERLQTLPSAAASELRELAARARDLNETNGKLIAVHIQRNQQALNVLLARRRPCTDLRPRWDNSTPPWAGARWARRKTYSGRLTSTGVSGVRDSIVICHASVALSAFRRGIVRHRALIRITHGGKAARIDAVFDEQPHDARRARPRQFPIRRIQQGADRDIVGMPFDGDRKIDRSEDLRHRGQRRDRGRDAGALRQKRRGRWH